MASTWTWSTCFAVLDRDQTTASHNYALNSSARRYFIEHAPISDYADMDRRMRSGELALAIEIPPGFGRDLERGRPVQIGAWVDGAMPTRGETVHSYVQVVHAQWLAAQAARAHRKAVFRRARRPSRRAFATIRTSGACRRWCRR